MRMKDFLLSVSLSLLVLFAVFLLPQDAYAETTIYLKNGQTYNVYERADWKKHGAIQVEITEAGVYRIEGYPTDDNVTNTCLSIDAPKDSDVVVFLKDVRLAPNDHAPGKKGGNRSAIRIHDRGGTVRLISDSPNNYFEGMGLCPAIRKDGTDTKLIFTASDDNNKIIAKADPDGYRVPGIGCLSLGSYLDPRSKHIWTGNIYFEKGIIEAWGSQKVTINDKLAFDWIDGGPGIGAGGFGQVDGITFCGARVYAYAGDNSSAAIGTPSFKETGRAIANCYSNGFDVRNINITGGEVYTKQIYDVENKHELGREHGNTNQDPGGASIGGGNCGRAHNIRITGGKVKNLDDEHLPLIGIGGGNRGDGDVYIGGDAEVDIRAKKVGIGAWATGQTDWDWDGTGKNISWEGGCSWITIDGNPRIKIYCSRGPCIGSHNPDDERSSIDIDGGTLDLTTDMEDAPVIGVHDTGAMKGIKIGGGVINAHRKTDVTDVPVIGATNYEDFRQHNMDAGHCKWVEITGGTIRCTAGDRIGAIGGNQGYWRDRTLTKVSISGGNVYAEPHRGGETRVMNSLDGSEGQAVICTPINMLGGQEKKDESIAVTGGDILLKYRNGKTYQYGLKDVITNPSSISEHQLYFWIPLKYEGEEGKIDFQKGLFDDLDAKEYYGFLAADPAIGYAPFYPPINLKLNVVGEGITQSKDGKAQVLYRHAALRSFERATCSDWLIDSYNSKPDGTGVSVLTRTGELIKGSDETFVDQWGWAYLGENGTPDNPDPEIFRNHVDLYAVKSEKTLAVSYDANIPEKTSSELIGSMPDPSEGYDSNDTVDIPGNRGFRLNGYSFTGWNTASDGSGTEYQGGSSVKAGDLMEAAGAHQVVLYAQWKPIKYSVRYVSTDPEEPEVVQEYSYDSPGKVVWIDDLSSWSDQRFRLTGWTYDGKRYTKGSKILNFVDFDDSGRAIPRTMSALWGQNDDIVVKVTLDGEVIPGLADKITGVRNGNDLIQTQFEELDDPGYYRLTDTSRLVEGKEYVPIIDGYREAGSDTAGFTYRKDSPALVELAYYTTTLANENERELILELSEKDGNDDKGRPYVVTPEKFELTIGAKENDRKPGYHPTGWSCQDSEPQWDPSKVEQTISVTGTSVLTVTAEANRYRVVFDNNGGEGEMDPQNFTCFEEQKLSKCTFTREGYQLGQVRGFYWSKAQDPHTTSARALVDEALIPANEPLTYTDGATVTLYAWWEPYSYRVTYRDPDNENNTEYTSELLRHGETDHYSGLKDGWTAPEGRELYGWREYGKPDSVVHRAGTEFKNLYTVNPEGEAVGAVLEPVWVKAASISISITEDGSGAKGKAEKIKLTEMDSGTVYEGYFEEDGSIPGLCLYKQDAEHVLPAGTYRVEIEGYDITRDGTFEYSTERIDLHYDFSTITVEKDGDSIESAAVKTPGGEEKETVLVQNETTAHIKAVVKDGYHFDKWTLDGDVVWGIGAETAEQDITVKGKSSLKAGGQGNKYSVAFDPNDISYPGSEPAAGTMENQEMTFGTETRLSRNGFEKKYHRFTSWNTERDGSGREFEDTQGVSDLTTQEGETVTLYAQWEPREYSVYYEDPYRLCEPDREVVKYNQVFELIDADDANWKPEGYRLHGWSTLALGSFYPAGAEKVNLCTVNEDGTLNDTVLYAVWGEEGTITVTVTKDDVGVDVDSDDLILTAGDGTEYTKCFSRSDTVPGTFIFNDGLLPEGEYTLRLKDPAEYGLAVSPKTFDYRHDAASTLYLMSDTVKIAAGDKVKSAVIVDPETGDPVDEIVVERGSRLNIKSEVSEPGYHFSYYDVEGTLPDMDISQAEQEIGINGFATLTALAAPNDWYLHFDANGGKGSMNDQIMTFDTGEALSPNVFAREHYRFTGWNTKADGSGTSYADKAVVKNLTDKDGDVVDLYAQWEKKKVYTISYDLNGGKLNGAGGIVTVEVEEDTVISLPKPDRKGYHFDYWKGSRYKAGASYKVTGDHSFKAIWKKAGNGGDNGGGDNGGGDNGGGDNGGGGKHKGGDGSSSTGDRTPMGLLLLLLLGSAGAAGRVIVTRSRA